MKEPEISRVEIPLVEPHFDEEATVLHAQPVVPLETVRSQSRARRTMFLVIALVGALMLGAVGATFVYKQRSVRSETAASESVVPEPVPPSEIEAVASGGVTDEPVESMPTQTVAPKVEEKTSNVVTRSEKSSEPRKTAARSEERQTRVQQPEPAVQEDWDAMMREAKRAARRRRAERREERARRDADSAGRIRDIFEGPNP